MPRKPNPAQTEIPVGNEVGRKYDPDEEYERVFGAAAAARERLRYGKARRCTCRSEHPEKVGHALGTRATVPARREALLMSEAGRKKRAGKHVKHPHKSPYESRRARIERRGRLLDDDYDARSEAFSEYSEADAQTEAMHGAAKRTTA